jgi:hypothetical protein
MLFLLWKTYFNVPEERKSTFYVVSAVLHISLPVQVVIWVLKTAFNGRSLPSSLLP